MAAEMFKGAGRKIRSARSSRRCASTSSVAGFVIQVWMTPRIHRYLGIGFALLILPTSLAITAAVIIFNKVLWAPAVARIIDRSCRYTVDKTTREVLFLPLPSELRQDVKPFVDVTVDRMSRGLGALMMLVLIQPWGLALAWYQLSFISLGAGDPVGLHVVPRQARIPGLVPPQHRHRASSRPRSAAERRRSSRHVETLVQELAHPDPERGSSTPSTCSNRSTSATS